MAELPPSSQGASDGRGPAPRGPRGTGRRIAQYLYYAAVAIFATAVTVQVTQQVFFPSSAAAPAPFSSCDDGLRALHGAVERGRQAAEKAGPGEDEEAALRRYRATVSASWRHRDTVAQLCRGDVRRSAILDAIERLRYSEEHGVRHQAAELTALRQRVRKLMAPDHTQGPAEAPPGAKPIK